MKQPKARLCAFILSVCLLAGGVFLTACKKEAVSTTPAVKVKETGDLTFSVLLETATYREYKRQNVELYAFEPGDPTDSIEGREPAAMHKLTSSTVEISFPAENGALYASYRLFAPDGKPLTGAAVCVTDATLLSGGTAADLKSHLIKGFANGDAEQARSLYAAHALIELRASELTEADGETAAVLFGRELAINGALLSYIDSRVLLASNADMQISLSLVADKALSLSDYAALLDLLTERYNGGANGLVSAILIREVDSYTAQSVESASAARTAELLRLATVALGARCSNGRVYLTVGGETAAIESYLTTVDKLTDKAGIRFCVALSPDCTASSLSQTESADLLSNGQTANPAPTRLNLSNMTSVSQTISKKMGGARFAVVDLRFPAADPSLQAALCTYAYHTSLDTKADFMIYSILTDESVGLFKADGTERPAAKAFRLADTSENKEGERLAASLLSSDWSRLNRSVRSARTSYDEIANLGSTEDTGKRLFDFSSDDAPVFVAAGDATAPQTVHSASFSSRVLVASLAPSEHTVGSGYRTTISAESIEEAYALTAKLLCQTPAALNAPLARFTLEIDGVAGDGRALSYTSSITLPCNEWQTVTFRVKDFTRELDPDTNCTVTLLMNPCDAQGAPISQPSDTQAPRSALFLHSFNLRLAGTDLSSPLIIGLSVLGFTVGLGAVVLAARLKRKRHTPTKRAGGKQEG